MINTLIETDAINSQKMEKPKSRRRVARELFCRVFINGK